MLVYQRVILDNSQRSMTHSESPIISIMVPGGNKYWMWTQWYGSRPKPMIDRLGIPGDFLSHRGTPKSSIYRWDVHYKPTIFGYPHLCKPPDSQVSCQRLEGFRGIQQEMTFSDPTSITWLHFGQVRCPKHLRFCPPAMGLLDIQVYLPQNWTTVTTNHIQSDPICTASFGLQLCQLFQLCQLCQLCLARRECWSLHLQAVYPLVN